MSILGPAVADSDSRSPQLPPNLPVRRILLIRLSHLGDVLHALPVFHGLRRTYPEARIAWAVQAEYAAMLQPLPGLSAVLPFARRDGWRAWWKLRGQLKEFQPQWTVDAQGNWKSAGVAFLSKAKRRTGFAAQDMRESAAAWVANDPAPPWNQAAGQHAIDRNLHLAAYVCDTDRAGLRSLLPRDWLQLKAVERTTGRKHWRERMGPNPKRPVILQLAAEGDVRAWPIEHQRRLLHELDAQRRDVLVLSGPGETELGKQFAREFESHVHLHHWVGQNSLRELAGAFRAAGDAGASLISCDSGPMHMGTLCGLRVIALAGPQDAARTGPWPVPGADSPHLALRNAQPLACAPCLSRKCSQTGGPVCMEQLAPEQVLQVL